MSNELHTALRYVLPELMHKIALSDEAKLAIARYMDEGWAGTGYTPESDYIGKYESKVKIPKEKYSEHWVIAVTYKDLNGETQKVMLPFVVTDPNINWYVAPFHESPF